MHPKMNRILSKFRKSLKLLHSTKLDPPSAPQGPSATATSKRSILRQDDSQVEPVSPNTQNKSPLVNLPSELRLHLFSILDLDQLSALVHASSVFHQDYLYSRRSILLNCLQVTFCSFAVDVYAAYQSSKDDFARTRTPDTVTQFVQSYQHQRASANTSYFNRHTTEEEAISVAAFYSSIIKPLARCYVNWTLTHLHDETKYSRDDRSLSTTEEIRLLRALYRFQLCCHLFGLSRLGSRKVISLSRERFESDDILRLFLCLFEPWEIEEIACFYAFVTDKYDAIFNQIHWDVHEENPKFEGQRPPTPDGAFDFDNSSRLSPFPLSPLFISNLV